MSLLDPFVLEAIRCPQCMGSLDVSDDAATCKQCACQYPVSNGVPVLLADAAIAVNDADAVQAGDQA